tara:strand:- start:4767 stop:5021 length:255 start_codon:yes stop_codon:yes gene_type:complete
MSKVGKELIIYRGQKSELYGNTYRMVERFIIAPLMLNAGQWVKYSRTLRTITYNLDLQMNPFSGRICYTVGLLTGSSEPKQETT